MRAKDGSLEGGRKGQPRALEKEKGQPFSQGG
jgi:hypothetical protein